MNPGVMGYGDVVIGRSGQLLWRAFARLAAKLGGRGQFNEKPTSRSCGLLPIADRRPHQLREPSSTRAICREPTGH